MSDCEDTIGGNSKSPRLGICKSINMQLADLKRQRGTLKGRLTLFERYISKLDKSELNSNSKTELELRIESACTLFQSYNEIQSKIEQLVEDSDIAAQLEYRELFEQQYFSIMANAKCLVNPNSSEKTQSICHQVCNNSMSIKLPVIKLPVFEGAYDQWLEYRNSYLTMIHSRDDLNDIQKFHYLKSSLSGSASHVISALEFTAENYSHAWDLLENRFHNNRLLVHNHVKALFNVQALQSESFVHIRRLIDSTLRNLRALKSLNEPTDSWDTLVVYLIVSKLDQSTEREWETHKGTLLSKNESRNIKLGDLLEFLGNRADMLEMIKTNNVRGVLYNKHNNNNYINSNNNQKYFSKPKTLSQPLTHTHVVNSSRNKPKSDINIKERVCVDCGGEHYLYSCPKFLNRPVQERHVLVKNKNFCRNCIRTDSHVANDCSYGPCKLCKKNHNTLLHNTCLSSNEELSIPASIPSSHKSADTGVHSERINVLTCNAAAAIQPVLLSTALIDVSDSSDNYHTVKALLDNGSQNCFITESLCNRLQIPIIQSTIHISGVGQSISKCSHTCKVNIRSKVNRFNINIQCLVLPRITSKLPSLPIKSQRFQIPKHISLADPTFSVPSDIDILIGADIFWDLLNSDKIKLSDGPYLYDSKLGWIISGPIYNSHSFKTERVQCNLVQINTQLKKFWELEELTDFSSPMSKDDRYCETLFKETTTRDKHGRFSVRIPLKESPELLGDSYTMAKNRFLSLERKLDRLPNYKTLYSEFITEYETLGHMTLIETENIPDLLSKPHYILPHHGVYREDSLTTKLRVVFDASANTSNNKSLNNIQYTGPPLQNDIFSILLRFRQYKYVACADIQKMYRQILIQSDQRNLQLILWRNNRNLPLQLYMLNTVTYGTASAPFLSMRCLKQLALDCNDELVARTINEDFFVDDLITGSNDLESLMELCNKISKLLKQGCFPLHKWTFNCDVSPEMYKDLNIDVNHSSKTLGLGWCTKRDEFYFTTKFTKNYSIVTKRVILSTVAQIYDPLGLLTPVVITAKSLLQKLWLQKLDWDDEVPETIAIAWRKFLCDLQHLHNIKIPRCVIDDNSYKELHIFTDASQDAYGACAYVRLCNNNGTLPVSVHLLCAKSKLAPIKIVSIPRLELCGALVGARLYIKIKQSLRLNFDKIYFWTDSTIVQGWLSMSPHLLKTFVQNRVAQINELTCDTIWRHVKGTDNPADIITRGTTLDTLKYDSNHNWWCGPAFLRDISSKWPDNNKIFISPYSELPEIKHSAVNLHSTQLCSIFDFERYSSFIRLQRVCAYLLRFIDNVRVPIVNGIRVRQTGSLSVDELQRSLDTLTRLAQQESFSEQYYRLKNKLSLNNSKNIKNKLIYNKIAGLNIFLDESNIIRVGGRLSNANDFDYNKKHPVLLSGKHRFSRLLCEYEHKRLLHAGPQLLVYSMRERWWILRARDLAKQVVHNCIVCKRMKGRTLTPLMGNLPSERLEQNFPFMNCGVDYAGPLLILDRKGRGAKLIKSYICLFVCFSTRAIHLELVGSLSTHDYILALNRFIARRGKPYQIFSDNGKNFVGAEKELSVIFNNGSDISDFLSHNQIRLTFIPPYSPHFGGLWEAGVKSCKHHLRRVLGNAGLTREEFETVLTQIEAVLNSRPLSPLSSDPHDFLPLSPAHFLIGRPLTAPICENLTMIKPTRLGRYDHVEQLRQHFWQRWSKEYISELQQRIKWKTNNEDLKQDSLVLIKEDNVPPLKWKLGRVTHVLPGTDGISRVAEIRTAHGIIRRSFAKICPLYPS
ncbi:uncharacterized protein LOC123698678 [Colias croceus]|uniref:uncharacterized protein LOC123698678 n=1 Tax=Colias crocea TaxID=72248 RepID=UPI001E27D9DD|nr:uncharacterized protein LOC123698678 [Colias croceus]